MKEILDETKILAVHRETEGNAVRTLDLKDEEAVHRMIQNNATVILLKIKIEDDTNQNE